MFIRFDTIHERDGRMDRHRTMAKAALAKHRATKNYHIFIQMNYRATEVRLITITKTFLAKRCLQAMQQGQKMAVNCKQTFDKRVDITITVIPINLKTFCI